jgi:DNA mismatch endonuclease, patch repair protein
MHASHKTRRPPPRRLSPQVRLRIMRSIKSRDTRPELVVRRILRRLKVGYRLHARDLPGRPDIVMRGRMKAMQVNGCLFHLHTNCPLVRVPRSAYWQQKLMRNKQRDKRSLAALRSCGWRVLVIWECETTNLERLEGRIRKFLMP